MSNYKRTREIRSAEDLEEHFRAVEAYIAGDDPETRFLKRVSRICDQQGIDKLTEPERIYLALADLLGAIMAGRMQEYLAQQPKALIASAADGLSAIGRADLRGSFEAVLRNARASLILADPEECEHESKLTLACLDVQQSLLRFASRHELF